MSAFSERFFLFAAITLVLLWRQSHALETLVLKELPATLPSNYGVLGLRVHAAETGVVVLKVRVHSPAEHAGLRTGDEILGVLPYRIRSAEDLSRCVQSHLPGSEISILMRRNQVESIARCRVTDVGELYPMMGKKQPPGDTWAISGQATDREVGVFEAEVTALLAERQAAEAFGGLLDAFEMELGRYGAAGRLPPFQFLAHHPLNISDFAAATSRSLSSALKIEDYAAITLTFRGRQPQKAQPLMASEDRALPPATQISEFLSRAVIESNEIVGQALNALDPADQKHLLTHAPSMLARFGESHYLDEGDRAETITHIRTLELLQRVDQQLLMKAALRIAELTTDPTLDQIEAWVEPLASSDFEPSSSFRGEFLFSSVTPYGSILVGGDGPNYYGADAALIIDLGGDDIYRNNCGAPPNEEGQRAGAVGLVIDLDGDDRYLTATDVSVGSAVAGVGMLFDKGGNDIYVGANVTQGTGFGGVGVVWDASGNDIYIGHTAVQASAFFGVGLLIDESGDDFYSAWQIAQGFGAAAVGLDSCTTKRGTISILRTKRFLPSIPDRISSVAGRRASAVGFVDLRRVELACWSIVKVTTSIREETFRRAADIFLASV